MRRWRALGPALLLGLVLLTAWPLLRAQTLQPVPPLSGHVVDTTGTLGAADRASLEQALVDFETRKGSQLAVLLVASTAPETIEAFSLRVAERWQLGRKKADDGAILVLALNDRSLRIEVGYGLEGALTDLTSKRIIDETIVPRLREQGVASAITAGVAQMMRVVDGEALPPPAPRTARGGEGGWPSFAPVLIVMALAVGGLLRRLLGKVGGALVTGGIVGAVAWFMAGALTIALLAGGVAMLVTLFGIGLTGRGFGGGIGGVLGGGLGRRGGGGGSGGGFSGGGGGFGGGGASGRW